MTLLEIRTQFVKLAGRYDLVEDQQTYADDGADFYIRAGLRFLDRRVTLPHMRHVIPVDLTQGQAFANLAIRSVGGVSYAGNQLQRLSVPEATRRYGSLAAPEEMGQGPPQHYVSFTNEHDADQLTKPLGVLPPTDKNITVLVSGVFFSGSLLDDGDTNWWTVNQPETLLQAALYSLERVYRNTQGMNDHLTAIEQDLINVDADSVDEDAAETDQMGDSWT